MKKINENIRKTKLVHITQSELENEIIRVIESDDATGMKYLLSSGVPTNLTIEGNPLLTFSILKEAYAIMKVLLESGADVNAVDLAGRTPLASLIILKGREEEGEEQIKDAFRVLMSYNPILFSSENKKHNPFKLAVGMNRLVWFEAYEDKMSGETKDYYLDRRLVDLFVNQAN